MSEPSPSSVPTPPPPHHSPTPAPLPSRALFGPTNTPYEAMGGEAAVRRLVDAFYDRIRDESPALRAMHPPDDASSRQKLFEFLSGWLGGPPLFEEKHGHPRLRMRHGPFPIDQNAVNEWLRCMNGALDHCGVTGPLREFLDARFHHTANFMRNR
ncbi:MAG TPA: group II truncated hemoglobin [Phycisphaerales bacterium]|nr:group II truncated hemoglobin [Phycisphaerales bacterium]